MPNKKGSCLNEEYTEAVTKIYELIKEALEKYEALPDCLKDIKTKYTGNSIGFHLINGETCARCFAEEFGINVRD